MQVANKMLLFNFFCIVLLSEVCTADRFSFVAAVVEYYPIQETSLPPKIRQLENAKGYIQILEEIERDLDIIVFPEATLYANAPIKSRFEVINYAEEIQDDYDGVSLCLADRNGQEISFLITLACAAKEFKTYLVVNLFEKAACTKDTQLKVGESRSCSEDGWDLYNTNVVFDRRGAFVTKYRKYNLFGEDYLNQTTHPHVSIFETDFGVKFGMFTCFDILFGQPALEMVRKHGVTHFIFPTMWFSELPFLTALQAQQQWAHEVGAVFFASGANNPKVGSGGSGIYQGKLGALVFDIIENGGSKAFVATLPKYSLAVVTHDDEASVDASAKKMDNFYLKKDDLTPYTSKLITTKQPQANEILCSNDEDKNELCCHFDIAMHWSNKALEDGKNHYQYRMVAFSGVRSFSGVYNSGVEICGIVACVDETIDSCVYRFENYDEVSWPVTFKNISISANFTVDENKIQHPNSLLSSIRPLSVDAVEWNHQYFAAKTIIKRTHKLKKPQNRLMTFAIYGRDFSRDGAPVPNENEKQNSQNEHYSAPNFLMPG